MFCVFNFNSKYYFAPSPEAGGRSSGAVDADVTERVEGAQAEGSRVEGARVEGVAVPGGEGPELEVVLEGNLLQNPVELDPGGGVDTQIGAADQASGNRPTGHLAEGSEANTADPADSADPDKEPKPSDEANTENLDQESELLEEVKRTIELLSERVKDDDVQVYESLQQLFDHNPQLAVLLDVTIRLPDGFFSYEKLHDLPEELQRALATNQRVFRDLLREAREALVTNQQALVNLLEKLLQLDSVAAAVKRHKGGVEGLITAIGKPSERSIRIMNAILIFLSDFCISWGTPNF